MAFSQPFAAPPRVILTPRGQSYGDTFAATTTNVTTTGFTANVWRADASGWGQSLQLDWMAWDALSDLSGYQPVDGTADVGSHANNAVASLSVSFPQAFSAPPTVLLTARGAQYHDTFSVTAESVTTTGFPANAHRWASGDGLDEQFREITGRSSAASESGPVHQESTIRRKTGASALRNK